GSWHVREPLVQLIDRMLGPDDLVGIMTPAMAASDVTFARKTQVLAAGLRDRWPFGERFTLQKSERERLYEECYPPTRQEIESGHSVSELARKLTERRRERATLEALDELVVSLRGIREERKAILAVSEGWLLFGQDRSMFDLRVDPLSGSQD